MADADQSKPSIEIINQTETVNRLYRLISEAEKYVFLVSPYVSLDKLRNLVRHLQNALARKVKVKLVIRHKDASTGGNDVLTSEAIRPLRDAGMEVLVLKDLHAKIYLSEKNALLTSLNLLESSFNNSIEVGNWLTAGTPEYTRLVEFLRVEIHPTAVKVTALPEPATLAQPAKPRATTKSNGTGTGASSHDDDLPFWDDDDNSDEDGHCIRCGDTIDFNPDKPLCSDCYRSWKRYENPDYEEDYCHACGDEEATCAAKPLCYDCYRELR